MCDEMLDYSDTEIPVEDYGLFPAAITVTVTVVRQIQTDIAVTVTVMPPTAAAPLSWVLAPGLDE